MEFLKEILGEELYNQFVEKVNAYNGNEANKDKQVKIANLGGGEYVGKGKFDALNQQLTSKQTELDTANNLITALKKASKNDEGLQTKISEYETQVTALQAQLAETKLKNALKLALVTAKAADVDYLSYKLEEKLKEKKLSNLMKTTTSKAGRTNSKACRHSFRKCLKQVRTACRFWEITDSRTETPVSR